LVGRERAGGRGKLLWGVGLRGGEVDVPGGGNLTPERLFLPPTHGGEAKVWNKEHSLEL